MDKNIRRPKTDFSLASFLGHLKWPSIFSNAGRPTKFVQNIFVKK
jgi:hypothetical protein